MVITQRSLSTRLGMLRQDVIDPLQTALKNDPALAKKQPLTVELKEMERSYRLPKILQQLPLLKHANDGLIFTPVNLPYSFGTCPKLFKWKPGNSNTVDFKINVVWNTERKPRYELFITSNGVPKYYDQLTPEDELAAEWRKNPPNSRIGEFWWDPNWKTIVVNEDGYAPSVRAGGWRFLRFRDDKDFANDEKLVKKIMNSIQDAVSQEMPQQLVLCFKQQQQIQTSTLRHQSSTLNFKSSLPSRFFAQRVKSSSSTTNKKKTKEKIDVTKSEVSPVNLNEEITKVLEVLARNEKNEDNVYKERAYYNAIRTLSLYPHKITSGGEAKQLKGIGESIARKIDEILETGTCEKLTEASNPSTQLMNLFTRVFGIGPVAAKKFVEKGYTSIEDLAKDPDLNQNQRLGIKYFHDFEKTIPREEMAELDKLVTTVAREIDEKYIVTVCGSYRRGEPESSDIDIVIAHPDYTSSLESDPGELLKTFIDKLIEKEFITDHITSGAVKYTGVCRLSDNETRVHRRIDIRLLPYDRSWLGVFLFTGDDEFNKKMRSRAMDLNMHFSEYILARKDKKTGEIKEPIEVRNEADIFRALGLNYIDPKDRSWKMIRKKDKISQPDKRDWIKEEIKPLQSSNRLIEGKIKPPLSLNRLIEEEIKPQTSSTHIIEKEIKPQKSLNQLIEEEIKPPQSSTRLIEEEIKPPQSSNRLLEVTKRIFKWPWTGISR
ncbi:12003_t:CDS:10 [Ambispora leptoticha]|uniref:12003_t:CDS:1 n=1 Tax=Ambispora leptoticha TaxID=144679 RepID=A0A9N8YQG6_9GLOM|nr:12003_t:CDS:10 [Ambispora leptoticha]